MKFQEITEKEYQEYWQTHPLKTFLSAIEIGKLRKKSNWQVSYVGVKKGHKLVGAAMLLSHKRHWNRYEFYSPRGYLIDFKNKELLDFFTKELKKYIQEQNPPLSRTPVVVKSRALFRKQVTKQLLNQIPNIWTGNRKLQICKSFLPI